MSKVAQFVVILDANSRWMESQALHFYSNLFSSDDLGEKYVAENLSVSKFIKIQNNFSVEVLIVNDDETPLSFMQLNSSRLSNQNLGTNKPIGIDHIVYFNAEETILLFNRAEVIAKQRKHDLIWVKIFEADIVLKETLQSLGYTPFDYEGDIPNNVDQKQIYFRKEIQ